VRHGNIFAQSVMCYVMQVGPGDGSTNWSQQVLDEFSQLITSGQRLIHIHSDAGIPLMFTDIYADFAAYRDLHTASFSTKLMAKGLVREMKNAQIVSWYKTEGDQLINSHATASLRWIDLHKLQMPAVCFAAAAAQPSYVVGHVTAGLPPLLRTDVTTNKKQSASQEMLPGITTDRLQQEKMERVDNWLKREVSVKMCVDNAAMGSALSEGDTRHRNKQAEVGASHTVCKPHKALVSDQFKASDKNAGFTGVSRQSSLMSSPVVSNQQQQKPSRGQSEMYDKPERDVDQCSHSRPVWTRPSRGNCKFEGFMSQQPDDDKCKQKYCVTSSLPASCQSKTNDCHAARVPVRDGEERPLFTRADNAAVRSKLPSCSPGEKKPDFFTRMPKHARDDNIGGDFPASSASNVQRKTDAITSPPVQSKSNLASVVPLDTESVASNKSSATLTVSNKAASSEDASCSSVVGAGSDDQACTSVDEPPIPTIPPFSLVAATDDMTSSDHDACEDDARSESSSSVSAVAKTNVVTVESDAYFTANETSSTVSVTPGKKCGDELSSKVTDEDPLAVSDDDTLLATNTVSAEDITNSNDETLPSTNCAVDITKPPPQYFPPVKLEIPESRRVLVSLSYVESPHRFWVNVASEQITEVDWVTEVLNTADLEPADPSSTDIELHHCYSVQNVVDKLFYRAELVEVCYGDSNCKLSLSGDCDTCQCNQLMRLPTDAVRAVRVGLHLQLVLFRPKYMTVPHHPVKVVVSV